MAVCLVAGGAGFLGSHLAAALLARGDKVVVVDNLSHGRPENLASIVDQIEVIPGDLRSHPLVRRAMRGVETVFHFAVPWGATSNVALSAPAAGAISTWHLLLAAREAGCSKVILASGAEVYGAGANTIDESAVSTPITTAGKEMQLAESEAVSFARSFGLGLVRLRYFNVFGPRQGPRAPGPNIGRLVESMVAGNRPVLYDHELGAHDLMDVGNAVRGCLLAADSDRQDGRIYNLAAGRAFDTLAVVQRINELIGTRIEPILAGPCTMIPRLPIADAQRATSELGFTAQFNLNDELEACIKHIREKNSPPNPNRLSVSAAAE